MYAEVVLDNASINGLLKMAADEGLLFDQEEKSDKMLASLRRHFFLPEWQRQQVLEQVVLNTKIQAMRNTPFDWLYGELVDVSLLQNAERKPESTEEGRQISFELIEGMLRAEGCKRWSGRQDGPPGRRIDLSRSQECGMK